MPGAPIHSDPTPALATSTVRSSPRSLNFHHKIQVRLIIGERLDILVIASTASVPTARGPGHGRRWQLHVLIIVTRLALVVLVRFLLLGALDCITGIGEEYGEWYRYLLWSLRLVRRFDPVSGQYLLPIYLERASGFHGEDRLVLQDIGGNDSKFWWNYVDDPNLDYVHQDTPLSVVAYEMKTTNDFDMAFAAIRVLQHLLLQVLVGLGVTGLEYQEGSFPRMAVPVNDKRAVRLHRLRQLARGKVEPDVYITSHQHSQPSVLMLDTHLHFPLHHSTVVLR